MKVALAQLNTTVGDLVGNEAKILAAYRRGAAAGVGSAAFRKPYHWCISGP